jgi:succinate dehydrogenase / fumarate reductase, cytochrome b subunit
VARAKANATAAGALMPERPLSPHLFVYKLRYTLVSSIVNRFTGLALAAGFLILAYWLMALASSAESYDRAVVVLSHPVFKLIFAGLLFSFVYHFVAGIRHLIWDTGRGLERRQSQKSAWVVGIVSVVLSLLLIVWALSRMGAP